MPKVKIVLNPLYQHLSTFVNTLPNKFKEEGESIYKGRNELKVYHVNGIDICVKEYRKPALYNQIIYTYLRTPKCQRAYDFAEKVLQRGFDTPEPIAYIVCEKNGLIQKAYFVSMLVSNMNMLYDFGKKPLTEVIHIAKDLAKYTAQLHEKEIYHKDYSPGNILYKEDNNGTKFCLVDINRMSFGPISQKKGCANFARLWGSKEMFITFATEYANYRGFDVQACQKEVLAARNKFWKRYKKKHEICFDFD